MSEGTSLEDIETGNVAYGADTAAMNAILSDMNAVEDAPPPHMPQYQPEPAPIFTQMQESMPPPMMPQHSSQYPVQYPSEYPSQQPQFPQFPQFQEPNMSMYEPVEESQAREPIVHHNPNAPLKRNAWSQIFDEIREPLIVGLLVTLFSLPALHTWLSKRLTWAYKVGGSLSWIGVLLQFALVAGIFATYRQIMQVIERGHG